MSVEINVNDPAVQQAALKTATTYGTLAAKQGQAMASELLENGLDADQKEAALKYGNMAANKAAEWGSRGGEYIIYQVQQGPDGVRALCFLAGSVSCANSVLECINPLRAVFVPFVYLISLYQLMFALVTMTFEASQSLVAKIPYLSGWHDQIIEAAPFLTRPLGRGLFYVFQGTLWISMGGFSSPLDMIAGAGLCGVGFLTLAIHYGWLNKYLASKNDNGPQVPEPAGAVPEPVEQY